MKRLLLTLWLLAASPLLAQNPAVNNDGTALRGSGSVPVTSVVGTTNQITAVNVAGVVTLSIPTTVDLTVHSLNGAQISGSNIATAIAAAGAGGFVIVPPAAYSIAAKIVINSANNGLTLWIQKGAVLTDSALADSMIQVTASNDVTIILDGKMDGAATGVNCIQVAGGGGNNRTTITTNGSGECTNTNGIGIDVRGTAGNVAHDVVDARVQGLYIHDILGSGSGIANRNSIRTRIISNRIYTTQGNSISNNGVQTLVKDNFLTAWGSGKKGIGGFGATGTVDDGNIILGSTTVGTMQWGLYEDTCIDCTIRGGEVSFTDAGIRAEVPQNIHIEGVNIHDMLNGGTQTYSNGILVNSRVQTNVLNALTATTGLNAGANVTLTTDAANPPPTASQSVKAALSGAFTTGTILSSSLGANNDYVQTPLLQLYVYSDTTLLEGTLQIKLASDVGWSSFVSQPTGTPSFTIPRIEANTWQLIELYDPEFAFKWQTPGIASWGLVANASMTSVTLHIAQLQVVVPYKGADISHNQVNATGGDGVRVETFSEFHIDDNLIKNVGFYRGDGTGSCVKLGLGQINSTAGQVMNGAWVRHNTCLNTPVMSTTTSRGLYGIMSNAGVGSNIHLFMNEIFGFDPGKTIVMDAAFNSDQSLNTFGVAGRPFGLQMDGTLDVNGGQSLTGKITFKNATAGVFTDVQAQDNGSGANNTNFVPVALAGQSSNIRFFSSAQTSTGANIQAFRNDGTSNIAWQVDVQNGTQKLRNFIDAQVSFTLDSGLTAANSACILYNDRNTQEWSACKVNAANDYVIRDTINSIDRFRAIQGDDTSINGANGAFVVKFNSAANSGTGGIKVFDGAASPVLAFQLNGNGNFTFGKTGGHFNPNAASSDISGTISIVAATSASHTFATNYGSAPNCVLTPKADPAAVAGWWVTTSTSTVTANVHTSGTIDFIYHCTGAPN